MMGAKGPKVAYLLRQRQLGPGGVQQSCGESKPSQHSQLAAWAETDLLRRCCAAYCQLVPAPRSTIALAFSHDGRLLASSHGDHTVKILCTWTRTCIRVLSGHRRTPWVVRFHPRIPTLVASGSLDYEVRLWNVVTGDCIGSHDFGRPIASMSFCADGNLMAIASGHKLYLWEYASGRPPVVALKTRRSLRAVHFHPQGGPLLLSAEVTDAHTAHSSSASHSTAQGAQRGHALPTMAQQQTPEQQPAQQSHASTSHRHRLNTQEVQPFAAAGTGARQLLQQLPSIPNPASSTADVRQGSMQAPHSCPQGMESAMHPYLASSTHGAGLASHAAPSTQAGVTHHDQMTAPSRPSHAVSRGSPAPAADNQSTQAPYSSQSSPAQASATSRTRYPTEAAPDVHMEPASAPASSSMHSMFPAANSAQADAGCSQQASRPSHCHNPFRDAAAAAPFGPTSEQRQQWQAQHLHGSADSASSGQAHARGAAVDHQAAAEACRGSALHQDQGVPSAAIADVPMPEAIATEWQRVWGPAMPTRSHQNAHLPGLHGSSSAPLPSTPAFDPSQQPLQLPPGLPQPHGARHRSAHLHAQASFPSNGTPGAERAQADGSCDVGDAAARHAQQRVQGVVPQELEQQLQNEHPLEALPAAPPGLPPSMLNMGWEYPAHMLRHDGMGLQAAVSATPQEGQHTNEADQMMAAAVRASAAAANIIGQEQPCRVLLRLWHYDSSRSPRPLQSARLAIPDTVLCSEMGVHISPCGHFLAACVAAQDATQHVETANQELLAAVDALHGCQADAEGSPRPPAVAYEVRIYSLEPASFGRVLQSAPVRAAHCLTSIQFSPTSRHLLLAFGRRHITLLRSLVCDAGSSIIPVHTILEVYRCSDMALVGVLPSAEDEVNAATWHPFEGEGIAYGTKEGRLRMLQHELAPPGRSSTAAQAPRPEETSVQQLSQDAFAEDDQ